MRKYKRKMFCEPLCSSVKNKELLKDFYIEREKELVERFKRTGEICGLECYLKHCAWQDDQNNETRVYLIKTYFSNEIVGYFALKAGMISVDSEERNISKEKHAKHKGVKLVPVTMAGIEISHFAINDNYRKKHGELKKLGKFLYPTFVFPIIKKVSKEIGVKLAYLYAADSSPGETKKLVEYYQDTFGFDVLEEGSRYIPVTSYYDNGCIFMYQIL